ncbi:MAG: hypothetical protein KGJ86_14930 [Chloroflexota bacterium]|nr:hypothetical protein [Chloroflexota bacterium]
MWVRLAVVLAQLLLRLAIRLAPFLAMMGAGLARKYRWRVYDRLLAYSPGPIAWSRLPALLLSVLAVLVGLGIALYFAVGKLTPGP